MDERDYKVMNKNVQDSEVLEWTNRLLIQQLIDKYEGKVKSAETLKQRGVDVLTLETKERFNDRIHERKIFIKDLKTLLDSYQ